MEEEEDEESSQAVFFDLSLSLVVSAFSISLRFFERITHHTLFFIFFIIIREHKPTSQNPNFRKTLIIMGLIPSQSVEDSHYYTHKIFLFSNYILLGAATSCIFLTLSLRLIPSICGFLLILLHTTTIAAAVSGCTAASCGRNRWYAAHMVATVLTAIFQGSVSVLIFTNTANFLGSLKSYVREEDAAVILKLGGGLCVVIFCLDWVVLVLAFFLKYYAYVEGGDRSVVAVKRSGKVQSDENPKDWPWPFQV